MFFAGAVVDIKSGLDIVAPTTAYDIGKVVGSLTGVGLIVAGVASFGFFVMGGIRWTLAGGEKGKIEEAQHMITSAIVGLAITALAYAIFMIVQYVLGVNIVVRH
ncbi:MAG TPA: hypothetical protein VFG51_03380 [Candidatus Saccharimonadia bacterium]|nr:hypothetical protein [Candidatus Saccharimonadia bacterium]